MRARLTNSMVLLAILAGCASPPGKPDWVSSPNSGYPVHAYMAGVGEGDTRKAAEDSAYGAIARIFTAQIDQKTREWESYFQEDRAGRTDALRSIQIRQVTGVSTRKLLEDVRIADVWTDASTGRIHALAVLDRAQASQILRDRIADLDDRIRSLVSEADPAENKLRAAGNLYRAINALLLRETYDTDLRIVDPSGRGISPPVALAGVTQDFRDLIRRDLSIELEVRGTRSDEIRTALIEGLARQGFAIREKTWGEPSPPVPDVLIRSSVEFQTVPNPRYKLVRWTVAFEVSDPASGRILGSLSRSGREGHLTLPEAENRAVRALQKEAVTELSAKLADFIFGGK